MAKFIVEAKSAKELNKGNFEVIEPYAWAEIREGNATLKKKLAILANTIEENELMDYHLSKACFEDEKKLKRKISDLKKERSELKQRMVNQDNRNRDLHRDLDSLERDKILLEAKLNLAIDQSNYITQLENDLKELNIKDRQSVGVVQELWEENEYLRKIVAQDKIIGEDFVIKDSKDVDWSNMGFDYSDNAGWTTQCTEWINPLQLEIGDSIRCLKDHFAEIGIGFVLIFESIYDNYYQFRLKNGNVVSIKKDSITTDSFERITKSNDELGWYVS